MVGTVYVTQTGTRYHARTDQTCMEHARGFMAVDLDTAAAGGLQPCITCGAPPLPGVTEGDSQWLRAIDDWHRSKIFDSFMEEVFARRVLANTPGITVDDVEVQAYVNAGDETYKVDFLIPKASLVVEVDGYAKDGAPPTSTDLERRNRRDSALQTKGLTVLHFSNAQVQQEPTACRQQVAAAIAARAGARSTAEPKPTGPPRTAATTPPIPAPQPVAAQRPAPTGVSPSPPKKAPSTGMWIGIALAAAVVVVVGIVALSQSGSGTSDTGVPSQTTVSGSVLPTNGDCPADFPYKGNVRDDGERIVHAPGQQFYEKTDAEMCFASIEAAEADGYRPAEV